MKSLSDTARQTLSRRSLRIRSSASLTSATCKGGVLARSVAALLILKNRLRLDRHVPPGKPETGEVAVDAGQAEVVRVDQHRETVCILAGRRYRSLFMFHHDKRAHARCISIYGHCHGFRNGGVLAYLHATPAPPKHQP